jgi:uncharacterized repeat protein (TIGR01451 family)
MNSVKTLVWARTTLAVLALYLPLQAEVKVNLVANKIVSVDGAEHKQSADKAKPGEVIEYVAEYQNSDKASVKNVMATLPVPAGLEYLPQSSLPQSVMASTDGSTYAPAPLKRSVRGTDGKMVEELVPYSQYRSLRWNLGEIGAGASKTIKARMKVKAAQ